MMEYTAEQLKEMAGYAVPDEADQLRAHAALIEENAKLRKHAEARNVEANLGALVARLARSLRKATDADNVLAAEAVRYLKSASILSPLREGDESAEDLQILLAEYEQLTVENVKMGNDLAAAREELATERKLRELGWSRLDCPACGSHLAGKLENYAAMKERAEKAEAERDAAVKDAERYRWLTTKGGLIWNHKHDAEIDAAKGER